MEISGECVYRLPLRPSARIVRIWCSWIFRCPEMDGFEDLRSLPPQETGCDFRRAFDQYAIRAFEVNALDYLLKPFSDERLWRCWHAPGRAPRDR